jgi:four helix bundle protein
MKLYKMKNIFFNFNFLPNEIKMKHDFRELSIWKDSFELVMHIYNCTTELSDTEKYGLISQIRRCAVSIPSNIAEGSGRTTNCEFFNFLRISISSSYELETQLLLIHRIYPVEIVQQLEKLFKIQKMIGGFIRKLCETAK